MGKIGGWRQTWQLRKSLGWLKIIRVDFLKSGIEIKTGKDKNKKSRYGLLSNSIY